MRVILLSALFALAGCAGSPQLPSTQAGISTPPAIGGAPVTIPRATQYDIASRINGQTYRVMVEVPFHADPGKAYPVLYVLDGNQYFGTAADALTRQSVLKTTGQGILVGIGYPTDDPQDVFRLRAFDLTPSASQDPKDAGKFGGADAFIRVLEEEIKPFVQARYNIDVGRQSIWGQSYAGLTVLRILLRKPESFAAYALSSPSIWWNHREVLVDEASFARRAIAGELHLKILVTSASDEQYRGADPKLMAGETLILVDNATELANRLAAMSPNNLMVTRTIFDGEVHNTVSPASLSRTMRFVFPSDK